MNSFSPSPTTMFYQRYNMAGGFEFAERTIKGSQSAQIIDRCDRNATASKALKKIISSRVYSHASLSHHHVNILAGCYPAENVFD